MWRKEESEKTCKTIKSNAVHKKRIRKNFWINKYNLWIKEESGKGMEEHTIIIQWVEDE